MSKAFTKESDQDSGDNLELDLSVQDEQDSGGGAGGSKNYMTPSCAERLRRELKTLLSETRPEVVRTVSWAASNGDRSENGDYIYGKRRLREIDRRIRFLTRRLDSAEIVDPLEQGRGPQASRALFGATVSVRHENGNQRTYAIVGMDEADPARGRVSWISPMAKVLLGSQVGDVVQLRTPKGDEELEIEAIQYLEIAE